MGALNGEFYGAYGEHQLYLTIHDSNDITGVINGTARYFGKSGQATGTYTAGTTQATIFLGVTSGGVREQWTLTTSDYNTLSGTRNFAQSDGTMSTQSIGLGRTS